MSAEQKLRVVGVQAIEVVELPDMVAHFEVSDPTAGAAAP